MILKKSKEVVNMKKDNLLSALSLFTSLSTLLCCALPALLVTLGAGATLAGLVSSAPWLVFLSKFKIWTFSIAGGLLLLAGVMRWQARNAPCPIDAEQARACGRLRKISGWIYWCSVALYTTGFFFAFLAVEIFF